MATRTPKSTKIIKNCTKSYPQSYFFGYVHKDIKFELSHQRAHALPLRASACPSLKFARTRYLSARMCYLSARMRHRGQNSRERVTYSHECATPPEDLAITQGFRV